eukprot:5589398-Heterocapsa_arctica.AAC.1
MRRQEIEKTHIRRQEVVAEATEKAEEHRKALEEKRAATKAKKAEEERAATKAEKADTRDKNDQQYATDKVME